MAVQWFYQIAGETLGPVSPEQLKSLVRTGKLSIDDFVREGDAAWIPASRVPGLFSSPSKLRRQPEAGLQPSAGPEAPPIVAPPVAHSTLIQSGPRAPAPPVASVATLPPPVAAAPPAIGSGPPPLPSANAPLATSGRGAGGNARLVFLLIALVMVLAAGAIAVVVRPAPPSGAGPSASAKPIPDPRPEEPAPLKSLDELAEALAPSATESAGNAEWVDAMAEPARRGDIIVRILSAEVGRPTLTMFNGSAARPRGEYLVLKVQIQNENGTSARQYTGFANSPAREAVKLFDDSGTSYSQKTWKAATIEGQLAKEPLRAGKPIADVLVFQKPSKEVTMLRLSLPAAAFGEKGTLGFAIPTTMLVAGAVDQSPQGPQVRASDDSASPSPGRGVPEIEQGIAEMGPERQKEEDPENIVEMVDRATEALGAGDKQHEATDKDFEEILRNRKDLEPRRRDGGAREHRPPSQREPERTRQPDQQADSP
ncbi:MAG: DUF4339 domain-containing protein [Pirellulales bacterium]|nr:DUF4339 domain-containing protein [Pirellulales bacterium]